MRRKSSFFRLIAELIDDIELLQDLFQKNRDALARIEQGAKDELDYAALGYTIHNIYNAIENYLLRIAKFFENDLDEQSWHRDIVHRMSIDITEVRPKLLEKPLECDLQELRAFRHIFRNIYQSRLDERKVESINSKIPNIISQFIDAHKVFEKKLRRIAEKIA